MFALGMFTLLALLTAPGLTEGSRRCSHKIHDLFIIVDGSKDVGSEEFQQVRKFVQDFVSRLDIGLGKTHVGLLLADHRDRTKIEIGLGQYTTRKALSTAVGRIRQHKRRRPDMGYALELVQNKVFTDKDGDRRKVNDVLVIFTNRIRPTQLENVLKRTHRLKKNKVEIITVYFKTTKMTWNIKDELTAIASIPENVLTLQSNAKLRRTMKRRICPSIRAMHPTKGCTRQNHDVFFVLDGSGSISLTYFQKMKHFLIKLIKHLDVGPQGTHVGLLQFSHSLRTKIEFHLGKYATFEEIKHAIIRMPYQEGGTDTGDALEIVNTKVFPQSNSHRPNVSDIVVILTDGEARDRKKALVEAEKLREKGVQIITVGMGDEETVATFRKDLKLMASKPSDVFTADFRKLPYLVKTLTSEICYARARRAIQCAHEKRDILMIVDGSASVGRDNIKEVKKFLQRLAAKLHVGKHNNHLALVQFSEAAKTHAHFGLDQYYDPKKIGQVIDTMEYHAGLRTMTGYALALANQKIFTGRRGDRAHASDVVILVADGGAHDEDQALENAVKLKQRGVQIVTVYIPNSKNDGDSRTFLRNIASSSNDFYTSNFDELKYIAADLVKVVCS